jgi:dTDP-L-rhamnose 4-epimerase
LLPFDVTSGAGWDGLLKLIRPEAIVHLAANTATGQSLTEAGAHARTNVVGTAEMLDALTRAKVAPSHILLASSRAVYGEGDWMASDGTVFAPGVRTHEALMAGRWDPMGPDGQAARPMPSVAGRTTARPSSVYGATKLAQEHVLAAWAAATGAMVTVLRFQNVYGPGQSLGNSYTGVVTLFARQTVQGQQVRVYEDGNILRDFLFVADAAEAAVAALASPAPGTRILDIGSGQVTTLHAVAAMLAAFKNGPVPVITGEFRDGDVRAASTDVGAASESIGFTPRWSLQDGLAELMAWAEDELNGLQ